MDITKDLDVNGRRSELENEAAKLLGQMLFAFSRLDMNLGLCLVWVGGGVELERRTEIIASYNINAKLNELDREVDARFPSDSDGYRAYKSWLDRAHKIRLQRNELVHGRWGVDPVINRIVNIQGLPTSGSQKTEEYDLDGLASVNGELGWLEAELSRIRRQWPL